MPVMSLNEGRISDNHYHEIGVWIIRNRVFLKSVRQESGLLQASNAPLLSLTTHLKIKVS